MHKIIEMGEQADYKKFWEQCEKCIRLGVHENSKSCTKIAELLRLHSSKSDEEQISMKELRELKETKMYRIIMAQVIMFQDKGLEMLRHRAASHGFSELTSEITETSRDPTQ